MADALPIGRLDPSEEMGAPAPLPPHVQAEYDSLLQRLSDAAKASDAAYADVISPLESTLQAASSDHTLAVAELAGATDSALRAASAPHFSAIDKRADAALRDMILAQEMLRANDVLMPRDMDTLRAQLEDETGDGILTMLTSPPIDPVSYTTGTSEPIVIEVPPYPPPPPPYEPIKTGPIEWPVPSPPVLPVVPLTTSTSTVPPSPPPPPPPPPGVTSTKEGCPPKPCPPPSTWERSQVCQDARPFYEADRDKAVDEGRAYQDPYNLQYYYTEGVPPSCIPKRIPNLDPEQIRRKLGDGCCPQPVPVEEPPPPPPPPPADEIRSEGFGVIWGAPDVCEAITGFLRDTPGLHVAPEPVALEKRTSAEGFFGNIYATSIDMLRDVVGEANRLILDDHIIGSIAEYGVATAIIQPIWAALDPLSVPDRETASRMAAKIGMSRMVERKTGIPMDYLATTEQYLLQYSAPQYIPTQSELDLCYLRDEIDGDQWVCLTRANGNVPDCATWVLDSKQTRPSAPEVVQLYLRGKVKTRADLTERLRELGVLDKLYEQNFIDLAQWVPTPPDVIRFMARDVFDDKAVRDGQYDKDFDAKFFGPGGRANPGPAVAYMRAFGVGEEEAKLFYRAHWEMPSATQLFTFLHRLRADRPEVQAWVDALANAPDKQAFLDANPRPDVVTADDVRKALEIDDKAPGWIDRLMATSYHPMTRTDALNAYHQNVMDEAELYHRLRDTGSDDATAKRTVDIQRAIKARRNSNVSGVWTIRKVLNNYRLGHINGQTADALLLPLVPDNGQRGAMIQGTDLERQAALNAARIKAVRKKFVQGVYNAAQALADMALIGTAPQVAQTLVDTWDQEHRYPRREATAKMISEWLQQRIITPERAFERLANLGYGGDDATLIVHGGLIKASEKVTAQVKAAKAEVRTIINDQRAAARQATRDLTEREKEIQKTIEKLQKEAERIQKELEARQSAP